MRSPLQGLWLPREDILGWRVQIGSETYDHTDPGPFAQIDIELDGVGCLTSGSAALKRPRHPIFPGYRFTLELFLLSAAHGWVEVGTGFVPPAREDGREEYSLELRPMEELNIGGYFNGSLLTGRNTLGADVGEWNETNETVISRILKRSPTAMLGTHADGTVILARPEDGQFVEVSQNRFYDWKGTGLVTLPYATESRWDGGPGWRKGQYGGIARPPLTPRKAIDAGSVAFVEVVQSSGPPLVHEEELTIGLVADDAVTGTDVGTTQMLKRSINAEQYAYVRVYDLEAWYEGSSLPGQDNQLVTALKDELGTAQGAYAIAHDTLGPDNALTEIERGKMLDAETAIRVARFQGGQQESDYEPLSAKLSLGFVLDSFTVDSGHPPASLITGTTMWTSKKSWDTAAVGVNPDNTDPDASSLIHPFLSPDTIEVSDMPIVELDDRVRNTPFQQGNLTIPDGNFRGPRGPKLAELMDKQWREGFDPEEPPDDAEPPSRAWDGKWYFYIAAWWRVASVEAGSSS